MGVVRAAVLIGVHIVIAIHIAHWWVTGSTISPLEPSEAMEFSKHGLINAGMIFFAAMILLTLLFGRFFCGWGCHIVALQDGSRWLLGKFGIKPRPMKSRLLIYVPIIAFAYMFLYPLVHRLSVLDGSFVTDVAISKSAFWETFPGWGVAALTFFVCGFAIIYLLGAKGFCTYGCPYGGIFGLVDKAATLRIRVTDACEHCGHCTAVCSSNVRVHEEVRDYGAVIDPGCMKCMDCVSVCPNDALYVGFGAPAMLTKPRKEPRTTSRPQYSWKEECVLGILFVAALFSFRGLYGLVPFLLSLGLAAIIAFVTLQVLRMLYQSSVSIGRWTCKRAGRVTVSGAVFVMLMVPFFALWLHSGLIQYHDYRANRAFAALSHRHNHTPSIDIEKPGLLTDGIKHSTFVHRWSLLARGVSAERLASLKRYAGDFDAFVTLMEESIALQPHNSTVRVHLADELAAAGRLRDSVIWYRSAVAVDPESIEATIKLSQSLVGTGQGDEAETLLENASAGQPDSADLPYNLGVLRMMAGRPDSAIDAFHTALERKPDHLHARENLAGVLCSLGRFAEGVEQFQIAIEQNPGDAETHALLARALERTGRLDDARLHIQKAVALAPQKPEYGIVLSRLIRSQTGLGEHASLTIEQEVRANILNQEIGPDTLRVLNLPESFVDRLVDRIIRSSYQHQFHRIVGEQTADSKGTEPTESNPSGAVPGGTVLRLPAEHAEQINWSDYERGRPGSPCFRVPLFDHQRDRTAPGAEVMAIQPEPGDSEMVRRRLAKEGLSAMVDLLIKRHGEDIEELDAEQWNAILHQIGIPVDLFEMFDTTLVYDLFDDSKGPQRPATSTVFDYQPTIAGFRAAPDSGNGFIKLIRFQWPRGDYWQSSGDGGPLDLARRLIESIPGADVLIGIEASHLSAARAEVARWGEDVARRINFIPQAIKIEQWARDNAISGSASGVEGSYSAATLLPRFASIRDDGSEFLPGESAAGFYLSAANMTVGQSPLLFQGGNILVAEHPTTGVRTLFLGEAEVYRNTAMGLTEPQVDDAFRRELGVDKVVTLPALSFHIDLDISIRAHDGGLVALVNDPISGAKIAAHSGLPALVRAGALTKEQFEQAGEYLEQDRIKEFIALAGSALAASAGSSGYLTEDFADHFSLNENDSGVGNLQRFQLALDILSCEHIPLDRWPDHEFTRASVRAYHRRAALRKEFHEILAGEGLEIVSIPSLVDADRAINYINAIHEPNRMYVPTYGGLFEPLDRAALSAIGEALGPSVELVPVHCAESQRRFGGIHCATNMYPESMSR